jgi:hypothetical protein
VLVSDSGRVGGAGWSPRVVSAWSSAFRSIARALRVEKNQRCRS